MPGRLLDRRNVVGWGRSQARNNTAVEREKKEVYVAEQVPELADVELDAVVSQLETYERRRV